MHTNLTYGPLKSEEATRIWEAKVIEEVKDLALDLS